MIDHVTISSEVLISCRLAHNIRLRTAFDYAHPRQENSLLEDAGSEGYSNGPQ